jgi:LacI family transcriptional regulator
LLDRLMDGEPVLENPVRIEPSGIVTRQSTDILAVRDLRVAGALTCIRRNFTAPMLNAVAVAKACGVPPRTLDRLFKQHLDRSVAAEIGRLRRQHAQLLLSAGGCSATEAAEQSGFASLLHLRRNLQRHLGMTPREWRQRKGPRER